MTHTVQDRMLGQGWVQTILEMKSKPKITVRVEMNSDEFQCKTEGGEFSAPAIN